MGRHSAPDDDGDDGGDVARADGATGPVAVAVAPPAGRPRPGRHSRHVADADDDADTDGDGDDDGDGETHGGLDLLEQVLTKESPADAGEDDSNTAKIKPIVDPILDEPVPAATTTVIRPVGDDAVGDDAVGDGASAAEQTESEPATSKSTSKEKSKSKRPEPRVSDRTVLRDDPAARARVIAAVVAPFVIYVAVLVVLDALDLRTFLIWIWAPLITAGVVAGLILDLAHRAAAARAITVAEERASAGR